MVFCQTDIQTVRRCKWFAGSVWNGQVFRSAASRWSVYTLEAVDSRILGRQVSSDLAIPKPLLHREMDRDTRDLMDYALVHMGVSVFYLSHVLHGGIPCSLRPRRQRISDRQTAQQMDVCVSVVSLTACLPVLAGALQTAAGGPSCGRGGWASRGSPWPCWWPEQGGLEAAGEVVEAALLALLLQEVAHLPLAASGGAAGSPAPAITPLVACVRR